MRLLKKILVCFVLVVASFKAHLRKIAVVVAFHRESLLI